MSKLLAAKHAMKSLLLALVAIAGSVQLFRLLLLPGIEAVFHPGESTTSVVRRTGIFLTVLLSYWAYIRYHEKRAATELRLAPVAISLGLLSGVLLILIAVLPLFAFGVYEVTAYRGWQNGLPGVACVILIAAFLEEVVYRGVLFSVLERAMGTTRAVWLQSIIFSAVHIGNNSEADLAVLILNVVAGALIGAFWTYLFVLTRNLWVVAANHAAWNFTIILSGTPLSGIDAWQTVAPIESSYHGPFWLTGGLFGPEDSIVTLGVVILCLAIQGVCYRKQVHARAAQLSAPLSRDCPLWRSPHA